MEQLIRSLIYFPSISLSELSLKTGKHNPRGIFPKSYCCSQKGSVSPGERERDATVSRRNLKIISRKNTNQPTVGIAAV